MHDWQSYLVKPQNYVIENGYSSFKMLSLMLICYVAIGNPKNVLNNVSAWNKVYMLSFFSRVWLCYTMDCSPPGFSVLGIFQQEHWSRLHALLQRVFLTQGSNLNLLWLLPCRWILYRLATTETLLSVYTLATIIPMSTGHGEFIL